jgi:hypothetical protein
MASQNYKFGTIQDEHNPNGEKYSYTNLWDIQKKNGSERLIIAPTSGHVDLIIELSQILPEPFGILYILVVPRGGNEGGRYENAQPASRSEMEAFLHSFRDFFENDARHHIWIASMPGKAMLVYDNHNVIYAYGEIQKYKQVLVSKGMTQGRVSFPVLHGHFYNQNYDTEETRVLSCMEWKQFPLAKSDE